MQTIYIKSQLLSIRLYHFIDPRVKLVPCQTLRAMEAQVAKPCFNAFPVVLILNFINTKQDQMISHGLFF